MPINKVVYGDQTLIDLTDATVSAGDLRDGVVAYDKSGTRIVGVINWILSVNGTPNIEKIQDTDDDYCLVYS